MSQTLCMFLAVGFLSSASATAAAPAVGGQVEIFADAVRGDDGNCGTSADKPLKTLWAAQKMMDKAPADRRVVLNLARGSVWREENIGAKTWRDYHSQVCFRGGRRRLTIRAYGEGDKPAISGLDVLPNQGLVRHDAAKYPNVWSQRVTPPVSYDRTRRGVLVDGKRPLLEVRLDKVEQPHKLGKTEDDALLHVNANPDTYYVREHGDGSEDYFINSGSDPSRDGWTYEYKVRASIFPAQPWNRWENVRLIGLNERNGIQAGGANYWMSLRGVEVLYGSTHNMLVLGYRFENVLSVGYLGSTAFHAHSPRAEEPALYGSLYDRCVARDSGIAFFDHAKPRRPWVYLRDCATEDVGAILQHGAGDSLAAYVIGHRHNLSPGKTHFKYHGGELGCLAGAGKNYVEDSAFRFVGERSGVWHLRGSGAEGTTLHSRLNNCLIYAAGHRASPHPPVFNLSAAAGIKGPVDVEYDHCTLILDFRGDAIDRRHPFWGDRLGGAAADVRGRMTFRNCILAVLNAPNMMTSAGGPGIAMLLDNRSRNFRFVLDNCVLTYIGNLEESAGKVGKDYVFVAPESIFVRDVAQGDYRVKPGSQADTRDAGYRPLRKPVYRPIADRLAAELPEA